MSDLKKGVRKVVRKAEEIYGELKQDVKTVVKTAKGRRASYNKYMGKDK